MTLAGHAALSHARLSSVSVALLDLDLWTARTKMGGSQKKRTNVTQGTGWHLRVLRTGFQILHRSVRFALSHHSPFTDIFLYATIQVAGTQAIAELYQRFAQQRRGGACDAWAEERRERTAAPGAKDNARRNYGVHGTIS